MDRPKPSGGSGHGAAEPRNPADFENRLSEIAVLEEQLIALKESYVRSAAHASEDALREDEATFLVIGNLGDQFALPIHYLEEVVQMTAVKSLPEEVRGVVGLLNYHGEILAVIDFCELLTGKPNPVTTDRVLVLCRVGTRRFALMVEEAVDVITALHSDIQVSDAVLPGVLRAVGVVRTPEGATVIVDALSLALAVQLDRLMDQLDNGGPASPDRAEPGNEEEV